MRFIFTLVIIAVAAVAAFHAYLYYTVGTAEPCQAAVQRIIQKQRARGNNFVAQIGDTFSRQAEEMLRGEGLGACYRSALTGDAPQQLTVKFNLPG
jgi:hypothetical protein